VVVPWEVWVKTLGINAIPALRDVEDDLAPILKKLGVSGKGCVRELNGKNYVIIKGYSGLRKILTGTRYFETNPKVVDLVIGSSRLGMSAIKSTRLSIILVVGVDVAEAAFEAILNDKEFFTR
jgi:hypothetical protein